MKISFIGHSGFLAELAEMDLLFDYYCGELPPVDPEKPLFVFVSHAHADHFSEAVFSLAEQSARVFYMISDDVPEEKVPGKMRKKVRFCAPREDFSVGAGGSGLRVRTYRSTDEGLAFLVDAGGCRLYHAGDLNDWHWDAGDTEWNREQRSGYQSELDRIAAAVRQDGHIPDFAFVPLDSRLGEAFWMGLDAYMRTVDAKRVFPMHLFGDTAVIKKMKALPCAGEYAARIFGSGTQGESFSF